MAETRDQNGKNQSIAVALREWAAAIAENEGVELAALPADGAARIEYLELAVRDLAGTIGLRADALLASGDPDMAELGEHYQGLAEEVLGILEPQLHG